MHPKRERDNEESRSDIPGTSEKRYCEPGPSDAMRELDSGEALKSIEQLELELQQSPLNVQQIGKIIADGILDRSLNDEILNELIQKMAKSVPNMANIDLFSLSDDLSHGQIDSRLVVIANAFLWNLLKGSMSLIRDKFDHYHFKMSAMSTAAIAAAGTSSGQTGPASVEFLTNRVRNRDHQIMEDEIFVAKDLLNVYTNIVFRKNGDIQSKSKQFIKTYFASATNPSCAIWHYSLRQSGASHKKWLQNIPDHILDALIHFMLSLAGLGAAELEPSDVEDRGRFFMSLGDTDQQREATMATMKMTRESLVTRFRQNVTDALNEAREMPFNTTTGQLTAPPRGKPIVNPNITVTWRQYEMLIKRCEADPSKENLDAKHDLDQKLNFLQSHLFYTPPNHPQREQRGEEPDDEDDDDDDVDVTGGIKEEEH